MTHFDLNGLDLYALEVFHASADVRTQLGSRLTEEFLGVRLEDATRLKTHYPGVYATSNDAHDDRVLVHGNVFVVRRDDLTLLVDTGIGYPAPDAPYSFALPEELELAGIARDDVDMVFLTHHHADHIGWLCNEGVPNFPNARHFLNLPDLETLQATQPDLFERTPTAPRDGVVGNGGGVPDDCAGRDDLALAGAYARATWVVDRSRTTAHPRCRRPALPDADSPPRMARSG
ncbi:MAG: MBL fold metallo-hydrolase [Pleurocapsa sp. SU_196_0]|nr:MBL fold metallo-hydrolase [Pleurocapsa sp. SU_196_0]